MDFNVKLILAAICSFVLAMVISPLVIRLMTKLKASQTVLQYVDNHKGKSGTPTMGGLIFLIPAAVMTLIFAGVENKLGLVSVAVMLGFGIIGFLDDFIKIKAKQNKGLKAYQKIVAQFGVSAIVTWFAYKNPFVGTEINLPFTDATWELQWWFIPFCFFIFIATTNAVNLTDGLDGLAGGVSSVYFAVFAVIGAIAFANAEHMGDVLYAPEIGSVAVFSASLFGALLAFLWKNSNPAKIFMGDTGSLALGGAAACVAIFGKNPLLILIIGIMFVASCISVIMQVLYFKATKKRIFLMAPLHHHFQYKGYAEQKIVAFYLIITVVTGLIALASIF